MWRFLAHFDNERLAAILPETQPMALTLKLLVVDAQPDFSLLLKEYIEIAGLTHRVECRSVGSSREAQEEVSTWHPSIVLLDAHLHDTDSFALLNWCNSAHTKVVMLSEQASQEIEQSARKHGADYLAKTENMDEIELVLNRLAFLAPAEANGPCLPS